MGDNIKGGGKNNWSCPNLNCGALRDLVPFVQFKKREKHPWRSVNFGNILVSFD